jgi:hypothetical protein
MTSEGKKWDSLKAKHPSQVAKALSSVKHPRSKDILDDVRSLLGAPGFAQFSAIVFSIIDTIRPSTV